MTKKTYDNSNQMNPQVKKEGMVIKKKVHFNQIDSTNSWAKSHSEQWVDKDMTLVTADEQTAGRGRFKRHWVSPPHVNIYATFCFWLDLQRSDFSFIPQILALAAAQTLEQQGFSPKIKWPNDLMLNGKKVAGILCEAILEQEKRGIICGIGLNVNMSQEVINQIDRPATSLWIERGNLFDVNSIQEALFTIFTSLFNIFLSKGFTSLFPLLLERSALEKGQLVRFHDNRTLIEARFEAMHPNGSVELRLADGTLKIFYAGEFLN